MIYLKRSLLLKLKTCLWVCSIFSIVLSVAAPAVAKDDLKQSLEDLENIVPLTYNEHVRNSINNLSAQKRRFGLMLGLARYYFPIYEKVFAERNIPNELKYLSVVESSLDPTATSRAEAVGPWQFLYEVGKKYGLAVNDSIDERRDPVLASNAAASYLLDAYNIYNHDWLLVIASYNCGHNNIKWAMEEAGGKKDYWSLRQYLPKETQNYVPAFIATVYLMNNFRRYGIYPIEPDFDMQTEVIQVKERVLLHDVALKANISPGRLFLLNPAYKKGIINGNPKAIKSLVIPVVPTYVYNSICEMVGAPLRVLPTSVPPIAPPPPVKYVLIYTIQPGDTFEIIASKFHGSTEQAIRDLNKIDANYVLTPGNTLKIAQ